MSVRITLHGESDRMSCECSFCGRHLSFLTSLSPDAKNKHFVSTKCPCLEKRDTFMCLQCTEDTPVPKYCGKCEAA